MGVSRSGRCSRFASRIVSKALSCSAGYGSSRRTQRSRRSRGREKRPIRSKPYRKPHISHVSKAPDGNRSLCAVMVFSAPAFESLSGAGVVAAAQHTTSGFRGQAVKNQCFQRRKKRFDFALMSGIITIIRHFGNFFRRDSSKKANLQGRCAHGPGRTAEKSQRGRYGCPI